ncbi:unnamed protein product [Brassica rapa]|uniref:Uncharacterized protein n=2 Tax=Brassica TaxID=3705 RepID=A0A3P5YIY4_BRACM|nr:unnamed protein product [Brassica napus]CAG7871745.1 unnamed protein product [Brassica rapa]CDY08752.1 BnaA06g24720D [Brassica napus]VDC67652.1 unnamed protein product [Brassica rapa]
MTISKGLSSGVITTVITCRFLVHLQSKGFSSNPGIATLVNAEEVTKAEPMTILQIFAYIQLESAEVK